MKMNIWLRALLIVFVISLSVVIALPADASGSGEYVIYVVRPGDRLASIARQFCTSWHEIYFINRDVIGPNPDVLVPGKQLTVRNECGGNGGCYNVYDRGPTQHAQGPVYGNHYGVLFGDTWFSIGQRFGVPIQMLQRANGMWNLYEARPVALVHAFDHIQPLSRARLAEIDDSGAAMKKWEGIGPRRIYVQTPDDPIEFADFYRLVGSGPAGLHGAVEHYLPMEENWQKILQDAVQIEPYVSANADLQQRFNVFMAELSRPVEDLAFFPYIGRKERLFLVFDRFSMAIVGVFDAPYNPALTKPEVPRLHRINAPGAG